MFKTIDIQFANSYSIYMGAKVFQTCWVDYCKTLSQRLGIITDSNLVNTIGQDLKRRLEAEKIAIELLSIPAGEKNKTRETKQTLEDYLLKKRFGRDTCLIALGGGVVTDLVGFVAATYCRGIPVIYLPTTLLAMVDASIGGKTGVDTPFGKNLIGAFYQPKAVFMDLNVLTSLPEQEFRNGMVEMLKHGLIREERLFRALQANVDKMKEPSFLLDAIYSSCLIKKNIVEQDERDLGIRNLLNFGHTIGHAIEMMEEFNVSHGEAVAIGMIVEAHLAALTGYLEQAIVAEIEQTLRNFNLPLKTNAFSDPHHFKTVLGLDKKSLKNQPFFVFLKSIGNTFQKDNQYVFSVKLELLDQALDWAKEQFSF